MKAAERRQAMVAYLKAVRTPVSGGALAERFGVSRQIVVQDVAVLKGSGYDILSTNKGYLLQNFSLCERAFKLFHTREQTEDELSCIVEMGGTVYDVYVWHKVYGKIEAVLNIFSKPQISQFMDSIRSGKSTELMNVTGGYHYHTVRADSEAVLDLIETELRKRGYIVPEI